GVDVGTAHLVDVERRLVGGGDPAELRLALPPRALDQRQAAEVAGLQHAAAEDRPQQVALDRRVVLDGGRGGDRAGRVGQLDVLDLGRYRVGDGQQRVGQAAVDDVGDDDHRRRAVVDRGAGEAELAVVLAGGAHGGG